MFNGIEKKIRMRRRVRAENCDNSRDFYRRAVLGAAYTYTPGKKKTPIVLQIRERGKKVLEFSGSLSLISTRATTGYTDSRYLTILIRKRNLEKFFFFFTFENK